MAKCVECSEKLGFFGAVQVGGQPYCKVHGEAAQAELDARQSDLEKQAAAVVVTTTPSIDGRRIERYVEPITAISIVSLESLGDFAAAWAEWAGGNHEGMAARFVAIQREVTRALQYQAAAAGADAVVAASFDHELVVSSTGQKAMLAPGDVQTRRLFVRATGTAVKLAAA